MIPEIYFCQTCKLMRLPHEISIYHEEDNGYTADRCICSRESAGHVERIDVAWLKWVVVSARANLENDSLDYRLAALESFLDHLEDA